MRLAVLRLGLLGPPDIVGPGGPLDVDTRKAIAVLAYLAAEGEQGRASLSGLLWPDSDQARGRAALRRTLSVLRQATDGEGLIVERDRIALDRAVVEADLWEVDESIRAARRHEHPAGCPSCRHHLETAADAHRGPFLDGFHLKDSDRFDDWVDLQREHRRRQHATLLEELVRHLTAAGAYDEAAARTRDRLALDPLHERSHQQLMLLHAWAGHRSEAVEQYRRCVATLDRELGVAPLPDTTALYQAILTGGAPAPPRAGRPAQPAAPAGSDPPAGAVESERRAAPELPLVGRSAELSELLARYDRAASHGQAVVLSGEAGIGKTRLANEVIRTVRGSGGVAVVSRCHEGEQQLPFGAVAELLRTAAASAAGERIAPHTRLEVARLVPEVLDGEAPPDLPPLDSPGARARFLEAICVFLDAAADDASPAVILLDDLQWADAPSLEAVAYLLRRLERRRLLVVLCLRPQPSLSGSPLQPIVTSVASSTWGACLQLDRLDAADVSRLLERVAPGHAHLATQLQTETEGVPFLLAEYLAELPEDGHGWSLPASVKQYLAGRVAELPDLSRQILSTAAVIRRGFDLSLLVPASGRSADEVASAIDDLVMRRFVRDDGGELVFAHDQVRSTVYDAIGPTRRRLLHARVADALAAAAGSGPELEARAGLIASHLERAGDHAAAADHHRRAANHARQLAAHEDALTHLRSARALQHPDLTGINEEIGDALVQLGRYADATGAYDAAAAYASDPDDRARLEQKLAGVHLRRGDVGAADAHLRGALELLGSPGSTGTRARVQADRALAALHGHDVGEAAALATEALHLAGAADDAGARAQAHNLVGMIARRRGDHDAAREHLTRSLELAVGMDDDPVRVAALNNMALVLRTTGELDEARRLLSEALERCRRIGDRHREAALLNNLADVEYDLGDRDAALDRLREAVGLFAVVGDTYEPEIWKLVDW